MVSTSGDQTKSNVELINALTFIQETVETPLAYLKQLYIELSKSIFFKNKIRYGSSSSREVINLSKHSFFSDTFKLLNKNLDFIPSPKIFSKKELDADAWKMKLEKWLTDSNVLIWKTATFHVLPKIHKENYPPRNRSNKLN